MSQIKLTKNELRDQQFKLGQLEKYLPTLQLKKAMLQLEVNHEEQALEKLNAKFLAKLEEVKEFEALFMDKDISFLLQGLQVREVKTSIENIAGIDIPVFEEAIFHDAKYSYFFTPYWFDDALIELRELITIQKQMEVVRKRKERLEKELRQVSIRVNLFEKVLIPRTIGHIKKIRVFLSDQQLSSVAQAKAAKKKIQERKKQHDKKALA